MAQIVFGEILVYAESVSINCAKTYKKLIIRYISYGYVFLTVLSNEQKGAKKMVCNKKCAP
jgi:hypothetical protein